MDSAPSPSAPARVLVARGVDGLLVGWLAVIVWVAVFAAGHLGAHAAGADWTLVYWVGAIAVAGHFGLSYHLAYRGGRAALRAHPVALVYGPMLIAAALIGTVAYGHAGGGQSAGRIITALITGVYLMTTWHYVKQAYGVARLGAAFGGVRLGRTQVNVLRYGLYPLWFLGAAKVLVRGSGYGLSGYRVGYQLLPVAGYHALQFAAIAMAAPIVAVFAVIAVRGHRLPPSLLVAPYVAAFLWLGLTTNPLLTLLLLGAFHAVQYLAVGHRAELALLGDSPAAADTPGAHRLFWWLNIFAGATCGGLLASRWLPRLIDAHTSPVGSPLLITAMFFVFLNLHHYLIDATIWRSGGELVRAVARPPAAASGPVAQPANQAAAEPMLPVPSAQPVLAVLAVLPEPVSA